MPKPNVSHPTRHLTSSVIDLADLGTIRLPDQQAIQLLSRTAFALRQSQQTAAGDGQAISRPAEVNLTEESDSLWLRIQLLVRLGLVSDRRLPSWLTRMVTSFKDEQPNVLAELAARLEWICLALSPLPAVCAPRPAFVPFVAQTICERDAHFPMEARGAAAARVDVAGGWTDTPPITYQMGPTLPAVLSLSIKVNGKLPIRCRCSRLNQFQGIFYQEMSAGTRKPTLHFASAKQVFANCNRPSQPGSLICAVLVIAAVVREELWAGERRHFFSLTGPGRGILIRTESDLPHGSGLGSSSILSAALLATLARLRGQRPIPDRQLIHAVLQVEQLHTTGGGWQDQMGGCLPGGAKLGWVSPGAGRRCCWRVIPFGGQLRQQFSHRLVLIYTGQTRLAKTLLQQVLLSWARGEPLIRETVERLAEGARQAAGALLRGEFPSAICMEYNELKKRFAQNTEPPRVGQLKRELLERGLAEAAWMAGAGGGGFLYLWLANGVDAAQLETLLANQKCWLGMSLWRVDLEELKPLEVE